jgi:hypothetical protein
MAGLSSLLETGQKCSLDALNVLRCCTFRIVVNFILGVPIEFLTYDETLRFVHKVNSYFKVSHDVSVCSSFLDILSIQVFWYLIKVSIQKQVKEKPV